LLNADIEFSFSTAFPTLAKRVVAGISVAALIGSLGISIFDLQALEFNRAALSQVRSSQRSTVHDPQPLKKEQVKRANIAISELNLPWPALLKALEDTASPEVVLLKLAPDPSQRELHIEAIAKSDAAMLKYSRDIQAQPGVSEVRFVKQALTPRDQAGSSRFELNIFWQDSL